MSTEHQRDESRPATVSTIAGHQSEKNILPIERQASDEKEESKSESITEDRTPTPEDDWETDPDNPRNWSFLQKWIAISIVSFYTFVPPLASSMMAPGLPDVAKKYNIHNETITALTLSVFLLSFALGPLIMAPLSELYGRTWVLHISNLATLAFNIGCAFSPSTASLIVCRFMTGLSGSAPIAIGGGSVTDCFRPHERAAAMSVYTMGPLVGPVIGPIAGGFIAQAGGMRWVFITIALLAAVAQIVGIPLRETYGPIILLRKLKKQSDDPEKAAQLQTLLKEQENKWQFFWINISRPAILLTRSFICFILSLYMAFIYGIYYLMFSTFPSVFTDTYGWGVGVGGLAYIGLGVGFFIATFISARTGDGIYKHLSRKNGGVGKPEMRLPPLFIASVFVPVGLFWYGWSAQAKIHWIMPIIGTGIYGFGQLTCFLATTLYLVDTFQYAASAVAAAAVLRSLLAFAFPLFGAQMYKAMGQGGGNSMLAGLSIVLGIPFPIWLYYKGEMMRAKDSLARH